MNQGHFLVTGDQKLRVGVERQQKKTQEEEDHLTRSGVKLTMLSLSLIPSIRAHITRTHVTGPTASFKSKLNSLLFLHFGAINAITNRCVSLTTHAGGRTCAEF